MAKYDPALIRQYADGQYSRASWAIVTSTCAGVLAGALIALVAGSAAAATFGGGGGFLIAASTLAVATVMGLLTGLNRAFWIRLEAQKMLCLLQIEINTRSQQVEAPSPAPRQREEPYRGGPVL